MTVRFRDRDRGAKALEEALLDEILIKVGIIGDEADENHMTDVALSVVEVASFHEFGLGNNPRRSFISDGFDETLTVAKRRLGKIAKRVSKGSNPVREADRFGLWAVGEFQERIARGIPPELDPGTIKRKGSAKPLIDTGQLRSSITHIVVVKNEDG